MIITGNSKGYTAKTYFHEPQPDGIRVWGVSGIYMPAKPTSHTLRAYQSALGGAAGFHEHFRVTTSEGDILSLVARRMTASECHHVEHALRRSIRRLTSGPHSNRLSDDEIDRIERFLGRRIRFSKLENNKPSKSAGLPYLMLEVRNGVVVDTWYCAEELAEYMFRIEQCGANCYVFS